MLTKRTWTYKKLCTKQPHVDRECYYEEVTTASFLAANKRGNLADAKPLLLGDDSVLANEDDDALLEEDFIDGQSDKMESCCQGITNR